jgi:NAD(P)-dependent dehydrogenase (short-subunit alcohol dehydrogenase family)
MARATFRGKVAVVTGAGSGIGRALSHGLAERGARLALSDIDEGSLAETGRHCQQIGADVHLRVLDVRERKAMLEYADEVAEHFGRVNIVINNAGVGSPGTTVADTDWDTFDFVLGVNLWGVIHGTKAFLPHLIASGEGHVVNISSLNGYMGQTRLSPYCASKFAVRGFTESLRQELELDKAPVKVSVVHPGGVATNIATATLMHARRRGLEVTPDDEARAQFYSETLLRKPAADAARIILDGMAAGRPRIRVGWDAVLIDALVRLAPSRYPSLVAAWVRRADSRARERMRNLGDTNQAKVT